MDLCPSGYLCILCPGFIFERSNSPRVHRKTLAPYNQGPFPSVHIPTKSPSLEEYYSVYNVMLKLFYYYCYFFVPIVCMLYAIHRNTDLKSETFKKSQNKV